MKQVLEHYGGAIIAAIVAMALMGILTGMPYHNAKGMPQILGEMVDMALSQADYAKNTSNAFDSYMDVRMPEIFANNSYACVAGEWVLVSDCFTAVDEYGNSIPITVVSGWSAGVTDGTIQVSSDGTEIYVSKSGVYWVKATVCTSNGRCKNVIAKLLVNEEEIT